MENKDYIKDLFSEQLGQQTAPVKPELWSAIQSALPAAAGSAATGISLLTKWMIGVGISAAVGTGVYLSLPGQVKTESTQNTQKSIQEEPNQVIEQSASKPTLIEVKPRINSASEPQEEFVLVDEVATSLPEKEELIIEKPGEIFPTKVETIAKNTPPIEEKQEEEKSETKAVSPVFGEKKTEKLAAVLNVPNVFSPNGDGKNDLFQIETQNLNDFSIVVLNKKGERVFTSNDPTFVWDGRFQDELVNEGEYYYFVLATDKQGEAVKKSGTITIVRKSY